MDCIDNHWIPFIYVVMDICVQKQNRKAKKKNKKKAKSKGKWLCILREYQTYTEPISDWKSERTPTMTNSSTSFTLHASADLQRFVGAVYCDVTTDPAYLPHYPTSYTPNLSLNCSCYFPMLKLIRVRGQPFC